MSCAGPATSVSIKKIPPQTRLREAVPQFRSPLLQECGLTGEMSPSFVSVAVINTLGNSSWGREGSSSAYNSALHSVIVRKPRQKLQTASHITPAVKSRGKSLHTGSLACLLVVRSISPFTQFRASCLGNGAAHSGLNLPTSMNFTETIPTDLSTGLSGECNSLPK